MKRIVRMLEDMKHEAERNFIKNSLIKRESVTNDVPDVDADLERIAELDEAINVLNNHYHPSFNAKLFNTKER